MKIIILSILAFGITLVLFISGCTQPPPLDLTTYQPWPTDTPTPTDLPTPTETLRPTRTPIPTIPPTATIPAPEKSLEFLNNVQVVYLDTFDDPGESGWSGAAGLINNGGMEIIGKNWYSVSPVAEFKTGEGVIIDFTFTQGSYFEMVVDNGNFGTDQYKRFGILIYYNYPKTDVWNGQNWLGGAILTGNFIPKPDTTYSLLLAILPEGDFLGVLWNPVDPSQMFHYREKLGKAWSDLAWAYRIGANNGKILLDNYRVIKFDGAK